MDSSTFTANDFRKLCYDIEARSLRNWVIEKIATDTYPNSFYYCVFKDKDYIFACNIHSPIFAIADRRTNSTDFLKSGFIDDNNLRRLVSESLATKGIHYNFLSAAFLEAKIFDKSDYVNMMADLSINERDVDLALKQLILDKVHYYLGQSIGSALYHYLDD